jgi:ABC-type uncharacterized transport system permease subunit
MSQDLPEERPNNLLKFAAVALIICFLAAVIVFVVLSLLGPEVGNIFTQTIAPLGGTPTSSQ